MGTSRKTNTAAARRRAQQLRLEQQRRTRRLRQMLVYGSAAAALLLAVGVALIVQHAHTPKTPTAVPTGAMADTTGGIAAADAMAIPIGRADAPVTLTVYDDFRCSACRAFHTTYQPALDHLVAAGTLKILIHPVTLIDANLAGTSGSLHAGNAAACAQDAGHFSAYRDLLYTHQPTETDDAYASDQNLITLARDIPTLDTPAFETCVTTGRYKPWIQRNYANLAQISGARLGTPTLYLNGTRFTPPSAATDAEARATLTREIESLAASTHATPSATH